MVDRGGSLARVVAFVLGLGRERNLGRTGRRVRYAGGAVAWAVALALVLLRPFGWPVDLLLGIGLTSGGLYLVYEARVAYCPANHALHRW